MSVITKDTIQPSSGQALTIKDEGGTASITVATNGNLTFAGTVGNTGDNTITNGNLVIGTAGKGIDFSAQTATSASGATTTSELLDHYEEGTWTLSITTASGFGTQLNVDGTPKYTKIGNQVTVMCAFYAEGETTAIAKGEFIEISGFPFALSSDSKKGGSWAVAFNYNSANSALFRAVPTSTGLVCLVTALYGSTGNKAGGRIQITGSYFV